MKDTDAVVGFSKTLIPNVCTILKISNVDQAIIDAIKQSIFDRRDAYLTKLNLTKGY